MAIVVANRN